jgi:hypothetical protein
MTAETLAPDRALPTAELLTQLLRVLESTPRRAPDDVVELVRRELERQAGQVEGTPRTRTHRRRKRRE